MKSCITCIVCALSVMACGAGKVEPSVEARAGAPVAVQGAPANSRVVWQRSLKAELNDVAEAVLQAPDGGFYIAGSTKLSWGSGKPSGDIRLVRTDKEGVALWDKSYGGEAVEEGASIARMADGNLLICGFMEQASGGKDALLVKVDPEGKELWSRSYGGPLDEMVSAVALADGSVVLWGNIIDPKDVVADPGAAGYAGLEGRSNIFIAKIDAEGKQLWSTRIGGKDNLLATGGAATPDGGFIVAASLLRFPEPGDDVYAVKVDGYGKKVWDRTWTEGTMAVYDFTGLSDGAFLMAGSFQAEADKGTEKIDALLIKIDGQGKEVWKSVFGDPAMIDCSYLVAQASDGSIFAAGDWIKDWSGMSVGQLSLAKLSPDGTLLWRDKVDPGSRHTMLRGVAALPGEEYAIVGGNMVGSQFDSMLLRVSAKDK